MTQEQIKQLREEIIDALHDSMDSDDNSVDITWFDVNLNMVLEETLNTEEEIKTEDLVDDFVKQWRKENNTEEAVYAAYHYDAMVAFAEHCRTYNPQSKTNELTQLRKLAGLLQSAWYNGNWKAETYNEREMEKIMTEQGYWPALPNPNQIGK